MSADKTELERMLEGRQAVEWGEIKMGDVLVYPDGMLVEVNASMVGIPVTYSLYDGCRFYRKIPVAKQGGDEQWSPQAVAAAAQPVRARTQALSKAKTDDSAKPPLAWLPWGGLEEVAWVQEYGYKKYGDRLNYLRGMEVSRNISCAQRHLAAYMRGDKIDSESGRSHLAHAACRLLFALQNVADGVAIDDVPDRAVQLGKTSSKQ